MESVNSMSIKNALCIDVDDLIASVQEAEILGASRYPYHVEKETEYLLEKLASLGLKATFFIPGFVTNNYSKTVRLISENGHEVASHGTKHTWVRKQSKNDFLEDVKKSKADLENITGSSVDTFKAPIWGIDKETLWALDTLVEAGFRCDHSLMPHLFRELGKDPKLPAKISNGLLLIPPTHFHTMGRSIPMFGGFYNAYWPQFLQKSVYKKMNNKNLPFNFYFHPFEFKSQFSWFERFKISFRVGVYSAHAGVYEKYLPRLMKHFEFSTLKESYKEYWN